MCLKLTWQTFYMGVGAWLRWFCLTFSEFVMARYVLPLQCPYSFLWWFLVHGVGFSKRWLYSCKTIILGNDMMSMFPFQIWQLHTVLLTEKQQLGSFCKSYTITSFSTLKHNIHVQLLWNYSMETRKEEEEVAASVASNVRAEAASRRYPAPGQRSSIAQQHSTVF